ncbi:hypothetical protein [Paenibacillus wynnii]|uniref:hypothetical protein n=1 Tax=Paenibacillus wynnii TaxID=268407 RepID=UPI002790F111|nr:hypothetical protein [Paenibacillus wynnii]MDQ0192833.1 hypothetical protein [Paenibacillus wynnii]
MKRTRAGLLILMIILTGASLKYVITEHQNKQAVRTLGMKYVRKEYAEGDTLKAAATCKPLFGGSGYQLVLKNPHGEAYYVIIMLGPERNLVTLNDLTLDVRSGSSVFPCR